jgi:hypothetical protein
MECPPIEPHPSLVAFEPTAERTLSLFGRTVYLALVPGRRARSGHVRDGRLALQRSPVNRILSEEAYWRSERLAVTPNKFPFAKNQRILWMANPAREPDRRFWQTALQWVNQSDGTALLNNIGAAATIPRAHAHLIDEKMPFLVGLAVRGDIEGKADALMRLADARLTATWNVIVMNDTAWIVPRGKQTPVPFFDQALGSAELWGRWCYVDEKPFEAATSADLEQALEIATTKPID